LNKLLFFELLLLFFYFFIREFETDSNLLVKYLIPSLVIASYTSLQQSIFHMFLMQQYIFYYIAIAVLQNTYNLNFLQEFSFV